MKKIFQILAVAAIIGLCVGATARYQYSNSVPFQQFIDKTFCLVPGQGLFLVGPVSSKKITLFRLNPQSVTPFIATWDPSKTFSVKDAAGNYGSLPVEGTYLVVVKPSGANRVLIGQFPTLDIALAGWLDKSTPKEERFALTREQE